MSVPEGYFMAVDDCSNAATYRMLCRLRSEGVIKEIFRLPRNVGANQAMREAIGVGLANLNRQGFFLVIQNDVLPEIPLPFMPSVDGRNWLTAAMSYTKKFGGRRIQLPPDQLDLLLWRGHYCADVHNRREWEIGLTGLYSGFHNTYFCRDGLSVSLNCAGPGYVFTGPLAHKILRNWMVRKRDGFDLMLDDLHQRFGCAFLNYHCLNHDQLGAQVGSLHFGHVRTYSDRLHVYREDRGNRLFHYWRRPSGWEEIAA